MQRENAKDTAEVEMEGEEVRSEMEVGDAALNYRGSSFAGENSNRRAVEAPNLKLPPILGARHRSS
jgi:hypothetical protein